MNLTETKQRIVELALQYGIVGFNFSQPINFKSGIKSPIYCDWRKCQEYPDLMKLILEAFHQTAVTIPSADELKNTVIAGVATGGIPHASLLAQTMGMPSCYVRPDATAKGYGLGKSIEGAHVKGRSVIVIEDLVSTAGSLIKNVEIIKAEGAKDVIGFCVFTYGMKRSVDELQKAGITLHALLTLDDFLPALREKLGSAQYTSLVEWAENPDNWFENNKTGFDFGYLTKLRRASKETGNNICYGMDVVLEALPAKYASMGVEGIVPYFETLFGEFKKRGYAPAAFKPNHGFYTAKNNARKGDFRGEIALGGLLDLTETMFPMSTSIFDAKRGDIAASSLNYAIEAFDSWRVDACTISGYMGDDSVSPFAGYCNAIAKRGLYILCITSNLGHKNLQAKMTIEGETVYGVMANDIIRWAAKNPGVGAVVGATNLPVLFTIATKFAGKDIPMLIPGVGKQGGKGDEVVAELQKAGVELDLVRINSSSGLTHPWGQKEAPANWIDECLRAYDELMTATTPKLQLA